MILVAVEVAALYTYSFIFMLEGSPANHGRIDLQIIAGACICLAILAPPIALFWILRRQE
jgi:hypothetical protein